MESWYETPQLIYGRSIKHGTYYERRSSPILDQTARYGDGSPGSFPIQSYLAGDW